MNPNNNSPRLPQLIPAGFVRDAIHLLCAFCIGLCVPRFACAEGNGELQNILDDMRASQAVELPTIQLRVIKNRMGKPVGPEKAPPDPDEVSRESLHTCLVYSEKYENLLTNQRKHCDQLNGQIKNLNIAINAAAIQQRQAQLQGRGANLAAGNAHVSEQAALAQQHQLALQEFGALRKESETLNEPTFRQFEALTRCYVAAAEHVENATPDELTEIVTLLKPRSRLPDGYAEMVLLAAATVRSRGDVGPLKEQLFRVGGQLQATKAMGFGAINMDRLNLSLFCETGEVLKDEVAAIKNNRVAMKDPRALCFLGNYCASRKQFQDAIRYFRNATAKQTDEKSRGRIAADVIFYELCCTRKQAPADMDKFIGFMEGLDSSGWQVCRARAAIASLDEDFATAHQLASAAQLTAPPLMQQSLEVMVGKYKERERYVITD